MAAEVIDLVSDSEDDASPKKAAKTALASFQPRKAKSDMNGTRPSESPKSKPTNVTHGSGTNGAMPTTPRSQSPQLEKTQAWQRRQSPEPRLSLTELLQQSQLKETSTGPGKARLSSGPNMAKRTTGREQEERKRKFREFHMKEASRKESKSRGDQTQKDARSTTAEALKRRPSPSPEERAIKRVKEVEEELKENNAGLQQATRLSAAAVGARFPKTASEDSIQVATTAIGEIVIDGSFQRRPDTLDRAHAPRPVSHDTAPTKTTAPSKTASSKTAPTTTAPIPRPSRESNTAKPAVPSPAAVGVGGNFGTRYTAEEDERLIYLKEEQHVIWSDMPKHFYGRTQGSLQVRYSAIKSKASAKMASSSRTQRESVRVAAVQDASVQSASERGYTMPARRRHKLTTNEGFISWADVKAKRLDEPEHVVGANLDSNSGQSHEAKVSAASKNAYDDPHQSSIAHLLRRRELGCNGSRSGTAFRRTPDGFQNRVLDTLGPRRCFHGMSRDVNCIAWASDGNRFAAGAIAISDEASMQYNRPNNLLLGNVEQNSLVELPEHHVPRPFVKNSRNVNALSGMRETQDPRLFKTVAAVSFSKDGERLFSAGGDNKLRMYDASTCLDAEHLDATVDLLSVNDSDIVATGCHRLHKAISVFRYSRQKFTEKTDLPSPGISTAGLFPTALKFGSGVCRNFFLAGFAGDTVDEDRTTAGAICVWDVLTGKQIPIASTPRNVFDVAWNPSPSSASSNFAVASAQAGRRVRSVVQCFALNQARAKRVLEWECPAFDINDVVYCPHNDNLIAAGATDGRVYIWDKRFAYRDQAPLHVLAHGATKNVLDHEQELEHADTGVRFLSWSATANRLYSGSSDGTVKIWDPYQNSENALVKNVATFNSAVMSGAFSPDYRDLLIGEDQGQLNLLSIDREGRSVRAAKKFDLCPAPAPASTKDNPAKEMLSSRQIEYRHMGAFKVRQAVQGPNYKGPFLAPSTGKLEELKQEHRAALHRQESLHSEMHDLEGAESDAQRELREADMRVSRARVALDKACKRRDDSALLEPQATALQEGFRNARNAQRRLDNSIHQALERCHLNCNFLPAAGDEDGKAPDDLCSKQRIPVALRLTTNARATDFSDPTDAELLEMGLTMKCGACLGPASKPKRGLPLCERVGNSTSRILKYITLVDLPGTTDTNKIRGHSTADYIRQCQGFLYIADIKRVITNPSLERAIGKYAERFPHSLAVVMTKMNLDIKSCKAAEDLCKEQGYWDYYDSCQQRFHDLKPKIRTANAKFGTSLSEPAETQSRLESLDELGKQCAEAEIGLKEAMVNVRNAHCTARPRLRQGKKKYLKPGASFNVFCVSNQHCDAHRNVENVLQPLMVMETTSIPALRTHTLKLVAPSLWLAKAEHINYKFSVLLYGLKFWSKSYDGKDRSKMLITVEKLQMESKLLKALETSRNSAVQHLLGKISQYTKDMTRLSESIALDKTATEEMFKGIAAGVESAFKKVVADCKEAHNPRDPESPFAAAPFGLSEALRGANKEHALALSDKITEQLSDVYDQSPELWRRKPETASEKAARGDIKSFLAENMSEIEYIEAALKNIRNKYSGC